MLALHHLPRREPPPPSPGCRALRRFLSSYLQTSPKHQLQDENAGPDLASRDARGGGCRFSVGRSRRVCVRRGSTEAGGRRLEVSWPLFASSAPALLFVAAPCQTQSHHPTPSSLHFPSLTSQPPPQTRRRFSCSSVLRTAAGEAPSAPTLPFHSPAGFSLPLLGNPATNPAPKPLLMPAENHGPIPALPAPLSRGRPRSSLLLPGPPPSPARAPLPPCRHFAACAAFSPAGLRRVR